MAYQFSVPTTDESPAGKGQLFARYKLARADSLTLTSGVAVQQRVFEVSQLTAADFYYIGGHTYILSTPEYTQLVAAGYGSSIVVV